MIPYSTILGELTARINEIFGASNSFFTDLVIRRLVTQAAIKYQSDIGGIATNFGISLNAGRGVYAQLTGLFGLTSAPMVSNTHPDNIYDIISVVSASYEGRPLRVIGEAEKRFSSRWGTGSPVALAFNKNSFSFVVFPTPQETSPSTTLTSDYYAGISNTDKTYTEVNVNSTSGFKTSGFLGLIRPDSTGHVLLRYSSVQPSKFVGVTEESLIAPIYNTHPAGSPVYYCPILVTALVVYGDSAVDAWQYLPIRKTDISAFLDLVCALLFERSGELARAGYYMQRYNSAISETRASIRNRDFAGLPLFGYEFPEL